MGSIFGESDLSLSATAGKGVGIESSVDQEGKEEDLNPFPETEIDDMRGSLTGHLFTFPGSNPNSPAYLSSAGLVQLLTCFSLPNLHAENCIITDHTVFYLSHSAKQTKSSGLCWNDQTEPYMISWVPVRKIKDQELLIEVEGAKPYNLFLCCMTIPHSTKCRYSYSINTTEGFSFPFSEDIPFKSWCKDMRLTKVQDVIGALQTTIANEV
eukprot:gene14617-19628_t